MRRFKHVRLFAASAALSLSSILSIGFAPAAHAAVDTCTWTGATSSSFSVGTNWTGCDNSNVPENGDSLVFDLSSYTNTPTNDMSNMSFANITFSGTGSSSFPVTGSAFTVTGNITNSSNQSSSLSNDLAFTGASTVTVASGNVLTLTGTLSGSGSLTKEGAGSLSTQGAFSLTGAVTDNNGQMSIATASTDASFSSLTLGANADFFFDAFTLSGATTSFTMTKPITTSGGTFYIAQATTAGANHDVNLTGAYTLNANAFLNAASNITVHVQGPLSGAGFVLGAAGSGTVINESTNNTSATPAGTLSSNGANDPASNTVTNAPATPDTGFGLVAAHPLVTLLATVIAAGMIVGLAQRSRKGASRR